MFTKMVLPSRRGAAVWSVPWCSSGRLRPVRLCASPGAHTDPRPAAIGASSFVLAVLLMTLPTGIVAGFGKPPSFGASSFGWLALFRPDSGCRRVALLGQRAAVAELVRRSGHAKRRIPTCSMPRRISLVAALCSIHS